MLKPGGQIYTPSLQGADILIFENSDFICFLTRPHVPQCVSVSSAMRCTHR